jgi:hypothetical protein
LLGCNLPYHIPSGAAAALETIADFHGKQGQRNLLARFLLIFVFTNEQN